MKNPNRRQFLASTATVTAGVTLSASSFSAPRIIRKWGANDRVRVGFIGVGNRGSQLLGWFQENDDVEVAALCDVYEPYTTRNRDDVHPKYIEAGKVPRMGESFKNMKRYNDFRRLLENKDIDAVCIATPDHWHAVQTIMALEAGKHVYVEKPLTITIKEGRAMVDAQKRTGKVCAVGLNRRGSSVYQYLAKEIPKGKIGKVTTAKAFRISNMFPNGIGKLQPAEPPAGFDWDLWLGPRAYRPYQYNIAPYYFRWWSDYSSQMGNWGVHYMDVIRWLMGERAPSAVSAHGGKYAVNDDRTIPDTMEVLFEFDSGAIVKFSILEASSGKGVQGGEVELLGTKGILTASQNGYNIMPAWPGQFQDWDQLVDAEERKLKGDKTFGDLNISENSTANLIRNFLDCIKSGEEPLCTLEEGHRSTSFAHLANMALAAGRRLEWDAEAERVTNDDAANEMLHYAYRTPWKL